MKTEKTASLQKIYESMLEEKVTRPADSEGSLPVKTDPSNVSTPNGNPDGSVKRPLDKKAEVAIHGTVPKETAGGIEAKDYEDGTGEYSMPSDYTSIASRMEDFSEELKAKLEESGKFSLSGELGSLLESEGLEEGFKEKAIVIFESAVNNAIEGQVAILEELAGKLVLEEVQSIQESIEENIDKYLSYVVENWLKENEVAIENSLRLEAADSFMEDLKTILEKHYVEVPAEKIDVYESTLIELQDTSDVLTEQVELNITLKEEIQNLKKSLVLEKFTKDISDVESEKIISLAEDIAFTTEQEFEEKLSMLHENFFPSENLNESVEDDLLIESKVTSNIKPVSSEMNKYLDVLKSGSFKRASSK